MKRIFNNTSSVASELDVELETPSKRRPNVAYKKLVVPMRMRSIYWKFFGFPANEEKKITTKEVIVCTLCKAQMVYNRNTSNLRTHLRCRHKDFISKIENEEGRMAKLDSVLSKKLKSGLNDDFDFADISVLNHENSSSTSRKPKDVPTLVVSEEGNEVNENDLANISIIFPNDEELLSYTQEKQLTEETTESTELSDAIMNFIVSDLISPDVVDGTGFHRLMSNLSNKTVMVPNESKITTDIIPSVYLAAREQLHSSIVSGFITNLSLGMEEWTSLDNVKCLSIYAHYFQTGRVELITKLLGTILCTGLNTVEEWGNALEKLLNDWNINLNAVSAVLVAFSFAKLKTYLESKDVIQIPCFMFLMERLCSELVFQLPSVSNLLKKCRLVVKMVQTLKIERDDDCELSENFDEYSSCIFGFDRSGLWLTTYYMLYGLLLRKNRILELPPKINECPLNASDWKEMNDLVDILESLKTIVTTFFEEKCPMISLANPLLWKVTNNVVEPLDDDSTFLTEIKKIMKDYLNEAYANSEVRSFTEMTTMLDPRFKSFVKQNKNCNAKKDLEEALVLLVNTEGFVSVEQSQSQESTNKKPNRLSGMNMLFNNLKVKKQALTVEDKIRNEMTYFEAECNALLEESPLQWWQNMTNKCPNLIRLARKYLCVPAMVLINDNDSLLDRLKFYEKRAALKLDIVDMLLFLHLNNEPS